MPRHTKLLAATAALTAAAAVVGGVAASSARSAPAEYTAATVASATGCTSSRGTLKYGIAGAGISQLDPNTINFAGQAPLQTLLYNGLAKYDRNMQVIPDLATKWRASKDLKTWFFYLRKDVKYATGGRSPPRTFATNILRVLDPTVTSQQRANAKDIRSVTRDQPVPDPVQARQPERDPPERTRRHQDERHAERRHAGEQRHGTGPYKVGLVRPEPVAHARPEPQPLRRQGVPAADRVRPRARSDLDGDGLQGAGTST